MLMMHEIAEWIFFFEAGVMINKADAGEEGATTQGRHQMEEELRVGICGWRAGGRAELRCD